MTFFLFETKVAGFLAVKYRVVLGWGMFAWRVLEHKSLVKRGDDIFPSHW